MIMTGADFNAFCDERFPLQGNTYSTWIDDEEIFVDGEPWDDEADIKPDAVVEVKSGRLHHTGHTSKDLVSVLERWLHVNNTVNVAFEVDRKFVDQLTATVLANFGAVGVKRIA